MDTHGEGKKNSQHAEQARLIQAFSVKLESLKLAHNNGNSNEFAKALVNMGSPFKGVILSENHATCVGSYCLPPDPSMYLPEQNIEFRILCQECFDET